VTRFFTGSQDWPGKNKAAVNKDMFISKMFLLDDYVIIVLRNLK
jgi:hypothetical protein